jgi:hypothetical protein
MPIDWRVLLLTPDYSSPPGIDSQLRSGLSRPTVDTTIEFLPDFLAEKNFADNFRGLCRKRVHAVEHVSFCLHSARHHANKPSY